MNAATLPHNPTREQLSLGAPGFTVSARTGGPAEPRRDLEQAMAALDVDDDQVELVEVPRPRTRGDCLAGERPCPWVGCRHHLAVDVLDNGSLHITSHLDLEQLADTCSLDVADRGEHTLLAVGLVLNLTSERVRQLETRAMRGAKAFAHLAGVREDALPFAPDRNHTEV